MINLIKIPELLVASNNAGKVREIRYALNGFADKILSLKEVGIHISPEESGKSYLENALIKARAAADHWTGWILSDDSGLEVSSLHGKPGIHSSRFAGENATDAENNKKLLMLLSGLPEKQRAARFRCIALLYHSKNGQNLVAEGTCEGFIISSPKGTNGFGFDPLFYIPVLGKTMAELAFEEKMQVSHRARALATLREKAIEYFKMKGGG